MTPAEYGRWLAETDGYVLSDWQVDAAARLLAPVVRERAEERRAS